MIRKFEKEDITAVMDIWLAGNIQAHNFIDKLYWKQNYEIVSQMMFLADVYVYEKNDRIIGFVGLQGNYLAGIFICYEVQSQGIGRQLIDFLKQKYDSLILDVYKKNNRAVKFYQDSGFAVQSEKIDKNTGEIELSMIWRCI
ncbi:MAG: GNAT family N-acetyltransferase [Acetobacter sp.]|nr:GNAT family N-acetyltransferase [Acetobacter sp.]